MIEGSRADEVLSARSAAYLAEQQQRVYGRSARGSVERIESLVAQHDQWRGRQCLNMNPAESVLSLRSRRLLMSDMATRLTEGLPGDKLYPHGRQNEYIDEIEAIVLALARKQFAANYVEWRPVSTSMALAAVFFSHLRPGDVVLAQGPDNGGNYAYNRTGPLGLSGAEVTSIPAYGDCFELDLEQLSATARRLRPRMLVVGGSNVLFPYPLEQLRHIADRSDAIVVYDGAHLGLLISSGDFQRPLQEGAHVAVASTHKIMGGPVGGLVLTNDHALASRVLGLTFPGLLQTRDLNKYAALACSLAETEQFGPALARQMVANAQALGAALEEEGYTVLARERGYTRTHQIFLALGDQAKEFETRCHAANVLISDCALVGDSARKRRSGARIATHELTRVGMIPADMVDVARFIARAARDKEDGARLAAEVRLFLEQHPRMVHSFDEHDL